MHKSLKRAFCIDRDDCSIHTVKIDMENSVDLVSMTVGILTTLPCLSCVYFDHEYFEWYPTEPLTSTSYTYTRKHLFQS